MFNKKEENKIKKNNSRIALRLPKKQRELMRHLVDNGEFKNLSHVIRVAIRNFLSELQ
jgi:Arc/MetJ-type ribon-helix-helix transcriptional regulator